MKHWHGCADRLFTARPVSVGTALGQAARHSTQQALIEVVTFASWRRTAASQELRHALPKLADGNRTAAQYLHWFGYPDIRIWVPLDIQKQAFQRFDEELQ